MAPEAVLEILKQQFPDDVVEVSADRPHPHAVITPDHWHDVAQFLRDDERLHFDWLRCLSGVDHIEDNQLTAVFDLHATQPGQKPDDLWTAHAEIAIKIHIDRDNPHLHTVSDIWPTANWHEREAYDLLGIIFDGHPDLRRILCCDDWVGHPLRKDYEFPLEYHGIPAVTEYEQVRTQH
ncbi:MAG: NADH-quinone oxidoreductase subunit C [Planctomycetes bacterium]|nr:NADH-quinone oxidoreductase subunit C [Planctomycetota bacterium]